MIYILSILYPTTPFLEKAASLKPFLIPLKQKSRTFGRLFGLPSPRSSAGPPRRRPPPSIPRLGRDQMRTAARLLRHLRSNSRVWGAEVLQNGRGGKERAAVIYSASFCSIRAFHSKDFFRFLDISASRALSTPVVVDASQDLEKTGPMAEYERRIASGEIMDGDENQVDTVNLLQRLFDQLTESEEECRLDRYASTRKHERSRWLWSRMIPQTEVAPLKGLYLYGGVGTGKTMLMDLFYDQLPGNWRKKRIHFHDFMLSVHSRLQKHRGLLDPLDEVAGEIADESILLCLDEFMVTDVADAMILNRLFGHLFSRGVVLVATSNRAPDNLYEGGLQRDLFMPFINTLKERCIAHAIGSSTDYRKMTSAQQGFYFVGSDHSDFLMQKFHWLCGQQKATPQTVEVVMGRHLEVPLGARGCAYFRFEDLCDKPLGAADYFGLFKKFHTLALEGVPKFNPSNRLAAYRFVTLVDVMYENKARLLCTAEASPVELFEHVVTRAEARRISPRSSSRVQVADTVDLCVDNELGFAKDRTISRLTEMNSREYLKQHAHSLQTPAPEAIEDVRFDAVPA